VALKPEAIAAGVVHGLEAIDVDEGESGD